MNPSVKRYFDTVPESRKSRLDNLHTLILELYPEADVDLSYKMPTYRVEDGWVAIANQKNYISFYTCGYHHIEGFKEKHPGIKTGKGCINFRDTDEIPVEDLKEVVRHAFTHPKGH